MAKAVKVKPIIEEKYIEQNTYILEQPKVDETKIDVPDNVEHEQEKKIEPVIEITKAVETKSEQKPELPIEERILNFIVSRGVFNVKMNDFLKSLSGPPKPNEPIAYLDHGNSRYLRHILDQMCKKGEITIENNSHHQLGNHHYPDSTTGKTAYYNLNDVLIIATKSE
jgi:hypothetical protein